MSELIEIQKGEKYLEKKKMFDCAGIDNMKRTAVRRTEVMKLIDEKKPIACVAPNIDVFSQSLQSTVDGEGNGVRKKLHH